MFSSQIQIFKQLFPYITSLSIAKLKHPHPAFGCRSGEEGKKKKEKKGAVWKMSLLMCACWRTGRGADQSSALVTGKRAECVIYRLHEVPCTPCTPCCEAPARSLSDQPPSAEPRGNSYGWRTPTQASASHTSCQSLDYYRIPLTNAERRSK